MSSFALSSHKIILDEPTFIRENRLKIDYGFYITRKEKRCSKKILTVK
jgi:hypothetical protein